MLVVFFVSLRWRRLVCLQPFFPVGVSVCFPGHVELSCRLELFGLLVAFIIYIRYLLVYSLIEVRGYVAIVVVIW